MGQQASSQGNSVVFDSTIPGYSALASGTNNLLSSSANIGQMTSFSMQILTDGLAIVDYQIQVTNVARVPVSRGVKVLGQYAWRDDAYTSNMWSTIASGVIPTGAMYQGTVVSVAVSNYRFARLMFVWDTGNTAGATSNIWACVHATGP